MEELEQDIKENPELEEAVTVVINETSENERNIEWNQVRDRLTPQQWGDLIQKEIITKDSGSSFKLENRNVLQNLISTSEVDEEIETETDNDIESIDIDVPKWSVFDKAAALVAVFWFISYSVAPLQRTIARVLEIPLGLLDQILPFYAVILIISLVTGTYSVYMRARLTDNQTTQKIQEKIEEIQDMNEQEIESSEVGREVTSAVIQLYKTQFKPIVWVMVFTIPFFLWIWWRVQNGIFYPVSDHSVVLPILGVKAWSSVVIGPFQVWMVWYGLTSISFTQIIQKSIFPNMGSPIGNNQKKNDE